jgi:hypothetical protein
MANSSQNDALFFIKQDQNFSGKQFKAETNLACFYLDPYSIPSKNRTKKKRGNGFGRG